MLVVKLRNMLSLGIFKSFLGELLCESCLMLLLSSLITWALKSSSVLFLDCEIGVFMESSSLVA